MMLFYNRTTRQRTSLIFVIFWSVLPLLSGVLCCIHCPWKLYIYRRIAHTMVKKGKGGSANGLSPKKQSSTSDQISLADGTKVYCTWDLQVGLDWQAQAAQILIVILFKIVWKILGHIANTELHQFASIGLHRLAACKRWTLILVAGPCGPPTWDWPCSGSTGSSYMINASYALSFTFSKVPHCSACWLSSAFSGPVQVIEYLKNNPEMAKQSYDQAQRIMQVWTSPLNSLNNRSHFRDHARRNLQPAGIRTQGILHLSQSFLRHT